MKRTFTLLFLSFVIAYTVLAQEKPRTLIDSSPEKISGFGAVLFSFFPIDGELATLTGGGGAAIFDNTFFIGGYGLSMSGDRKISKEGVDYRASYGHGGVWLGYILKPEDLFHLGIESKLGWGHIRYNTETPGGTQPASDKVFVFYPKLTGEVNLTSWFKVNASLGYQKTVGVDDFYFTKNDLDGPAFSIGFLFGWFN